MISRSHINCDWGIQVIDGHGLFSAGWDELRPCPLLGQVSVRPGLTSAQLGFRGFEIALSRQVSDAAKFPAVWTNPSNRVTADPPLILSHAGKTNLETAVASPTKSLLLAATMAEVFLLSFLSQLNRSFHWGNPVGATSWCRPTYFSSEEAQRGGHSYT